MHCIVIAAVIVILLACGFAACKIQKEGFVYGIDQKKICLKRCKSGWFGPYKECSEKCGIMSMHCSLSCQNAQTVGSYNACHVKCMSRPIMSVAK